MEATQQHKKSFFFLSSSSLLLHEMKHQHPPFCVMFSFSFCFSFYASFFFNRFREFSEREEKNCMCVCVRNRLKEKNPLLRADEGRNEKGMKMDMKQNVSKFRKSLIFFLLEDIFSGTAFDIIFVKVYP